MNHPERTEAFLKELQKLSDTIDKDLDDQDGVYAAMEEFYDTLIKAGLDHSRLLGGLACVAALKDFRSGAGPWHVFCEFDRKKDAKWKV